MAKKVTATSNSQVQEQTVTAPFLGHSTGLADSTPDQENKAKAGGPPSGFYIYIGPNIRGFIRNGTIYRGDRAHALAETKKAIERYPLVKSLIVTGDYLPVARLKVKTSGNSLHASYMKLVKQVKSENAKQ